MLTIGARKRNQSLYLNLTILSIPGQSSPSRLLRNKGVKTG